MTNLTNIKVSYHFQNDRTGRKAQIDAIVGNNWGQPIKEAFVTDSWKVLTDKGLCFVLTADKSLIMTYYLVTMATVNKFYNHGKVPAFIERRVQQNASAYLKLYGESMRYKKELKRY